jgi:hypothetical protein
LQIGFSAIFRQQEMILRVHIADILCIKKCIIACWLSATQSHLTSCTPTKSGLYFDISLEIVTSETALCNLLTFHVPDICYSLLKLFI